MIAKATIEKFGDGSTRIIEEPLPVPSEHRFILGLDLGKSQDYTALSALEMIDNHEEAKDATYHCWYLERFKLGTSYPDQVARVRELCKREPLLTNKPWLAVDQTGVGAVVVDLFRRAHLNAIMRPILIHGGAATTDEGGVYHVPKRELVGVVQVALQTGRLKIAADLPETAILTQELQNFQVEISDSGRDTYEARVGAHDDLVLSVAMALWLAQKRSYWRML